MQSRLALLSFWALLAALLAINGASAREVRNEHTHLVRVRRELAERAELTVQPQCTDPSVVRVLFLSFSFSFCRGGT